MGGAMEACSPNNQVFLNLGMQLDVIFLS
jgi:hypothetical protein